VERDDLAVWFCWARYLTTPAFTSSGLIWLRKKRVFSVRVFDRVVLSHVAAISAVSGRFGAFDLRDRGVFGV